MKVLGPGSLEIRSPLGRDGEPDNGRQVGPHPSADEQGGEDEGRGLAGWRAAHGVELDSWDEEG